MAAIDEIYRYLNEIAPFSTAMDFDNAGFLVGDGKTEVTKALVTLDITAQSVSQAREKGAQLIVSHHPVIFHPLKRLLSNSIPYLLAKEGIGAICAHTNLDMAPGGVNDCLAAALGLSGRMEVAFYGELPCCVMGTLAQPMEPKSFAAFVKERLSCEGIRYVAGNRPVRKAALCSGAGGEFLFDAMEKGADAFVTGEVKHHEILAAKEAGLTLVDGGHFKTEDIAMEPLRERLSRAFPGIEFFLEENAGDGIRYL